MEGVEVSLKEISESAELVEEHEEENEEEHDPDGETAARLGEDVVHFGHGLLEQRLGLSSRSSFPGPSSLLSPPRNGRGSLHVTHSPPTDRDVLQLLHLLAQIAHVLLAFCSLTPARLPSLSAPTRLVAPLPLPPGRGEFA